jgi:hypothetical protein
MSVFPRCAVVHRASANPAMVQAFGGRNGGPARRRNPVELRRQSMEGKTRAFLIGGGLKAGEDSQSAATHCGASKLRSQLPASYVGRKLPFLVGRGDKLCR